MRFSTAVAVAISASATLVAAQTKCAAQNIVDTCVSSYQSRIDACNKKGNDFICLCDVYSDVLVCYNNCPDSQDRPPVENTVTSYCNAAEPLRAAASSSMASVASVAATQSHSTPSQTSDASTTPTGTGATKATASPSVTSFSGDKSGADKTTFNAAGGLLALFGAAALL